MATPRKPASSSTPDPTTDTTEASPARLAEAVRASAQQIWLAGMGAFAKAQEEGTKVFETLVKEGSTLQRKTQSLAEERLGQFSSRAQSVAEDVSTKAGASWDRLESIFETRTAQALQRLGMPTAQALSELQARVQALEAAVASMKAPTGPQDNPVKAKGARAAAPRAAPPKAPAKAAARAPRPKAKPRSA